MIINHKITFNFSEEEISFVRNLWHSLMDLEDDEYDALCADAEVSNDFFENLDNLLQFMENNKE